MSKIRNTLKDIKFIKIKRNSFIDRATSLYLANESQTWTIGETDENHPLYSLRKPENEYINCHIEINTSKIDSMLQLLIAEIQEEEKIFKQIDSYLEINYKEIIETPEDTINKIMTYLNHETVKTNSKYVKMTPRKEQFTIKKIIRRRFIKLI